MYKPKKNEPFFESLGFLRNLRQIPSSTEKSYLKKFFAMFFLSNAFSICFTAVGPLLHLIMSVSVHSGMGLTEDLTVLFGATGGVVVVLLFTIKFEEWSDYFKDLVDTSEFGKPAVFDETIARLNRNGKICILCFPWATVIYSLSALSSGCSNIKIAGFQEICPTFFPIWLPFGDNDKRVAGVVFFLQIIFIGIFTALVFQTECFIMYEATEILICHISHLKDNIRRMFDTSSLSESKQNVRFCLVYHKHILQLGQRLSSLIKYTGGHMSLLSALVCGCVANQVLRTKPIGAIFFMVAWLFALFCFCHAGQRLQDETKSVGDAVWNSKWYRADSHTLKDVLFILIRSQKPINYEALPLGVMDYPFYFMMIKTDYSYFALFNQSM